MSNFMGVGIFWIGLNLADLGCWRLTLNCHLTIYWLIIFNTREAESSNLTCIQIVHSLQSCTGSNCMVYQGDFN